MLANEGLSQVLLYQRNTNQINKQEPFCHGSSPLIPMQTPIWHGTWAPSAGAITPSPSRTSHWAVAIGDFSQPYQIRNIHAGLDRLILDSNGMDPPGLTSVPLMLASAHPYGPGPAAVPAAP